MSALRDLVGGAGASCAAPDERASSSNPLGRLADAVLGDRKGKHPEHLRPRARRRPRRVRRPVPLGAAPPRKPPRRGRPRLLRPPGRTRPFPGPAPGDADVAEFLRFQEARARGAPPGVVPQGPGAAPGAVPSGAVATRRPDHPALSAALRSAVASVNQPAAHVPPPADLTLSPAEKTLIRNRSAIMARHLRGDSSDDALTARLGAALSPLGVDPAHVGPMEGPRGLAARALAPPFAAAEAAADARGAWAREFGRGGVSGDWVGDFAKMRVAVDGDANAVSSAAAAAAAARPPAGPQTWAEEYSGVKQSSGGAWSMGSGEARTDASGATATRRRVGGRVRARTANRGRDVGARAASSASEPLTAAQAETAAQSARPAETLSADPDAKFRSSQFLRFVSRMSRGEIVVEGDGVKEVAAPEPSAAHRATGAAWADEFAAARARPGQTRSPRPPPLRRRDGRMNFAMIPHPPSAAVSSGPSDAAHRWADEFADVPDQWAREFEEMRRDGGDWAHESVWDQIAAETATHRAAERSRYDFVDPNPYLGREDHVGRRKGSVSSRGVVRGGLGARGGGSRRPGPVRGLASARDGTRGERRRSPRHRRDDARQRGGPERPRGAPLPRRLAHQRAGPGGGDRTHAALVTRTDEVRRARGGTRGVDGRRAGHAGFGAGTVSPSRRRAQDADVHAVLGVLAHLSRSYDEAIDAFNTALDINPQDYSLWNKLGATQANSARSSGSMRAYQRASISNPITCARGPTYMTSGSPTRENTRRAWRITCARWDSTRGRRACGGTCGFRSGAAGRVDLMEAVDARNLDALAAEFPL